MTGVTVSESVNSDHSTKGDSMRKLALLVAATATAMIASTGLVGVAVADAPPLPGVTVAAGLNNPRQLTFDHQGNLYVAEAGSRAAERDRPVGYLRTGSRRARVARAIPARSPRSRILGARPTPGGSSAGCCLSRPLTEPPQPAWTRSR